MKLESGSSETIAKVVNAGGVENQKTANLDKWTMEVDHIKLSTKPGVEWV